MLLMIMNEWALGRECGNCSLLRIWYVGWRFGSTDICIVMASRV
jgi:hypothetical protein